MPRKRRRSPAEKKALSYAKDRRNAYGENDKAARKLIPLRKAQGHRKVRRNARQQAALIGSELLTEVRSDLAENALRTDLAGKQRWKKSPDIALAEKVKHGKARRIYSSGRKKWLQENMAKAREDGKTSVRYGWCGSEVDSIFEAE